jgi:hypothetical protein
MSPVDPSQPLARIRYPLGTLVGAPVVYLLDAFALNQGALAVLVALVVLVALIPALIVSAVKRDGQRAAVWGLRAGAFTVAAIAVISTNAWQNHEARRRADIVIAACERFQAATGQYPTQLAELVPAYLPGVPRAKYVLAFGAFTYDARPDRHTLMYVSLPPFGRPYFVFEEKRWSTLD